MLSRESCNVQRCYSFVPVVGLVDGGPLSIKSLMMLVCPFSDAIHKVVCMYQCAHSWAGRGLPELETALDQARVEGGGFQSKLLETMVQIVLLFRFLSDCEHTPSCPPVADAEGGRRDEGWREGAQTRHTSRMITDTDQGVEVLSR